MDLLISDNLKKEFFSSMMFCVGIRFSCLYGRLSLFFKSHRLDHLVTTGFNPLHVIGNKYECRRHVLCCIAKFNAALPLFWIAK